MTAITTPKLANSTDSLLRFALRTDATCSGLMGIAGIPLAGWLAETSGTTKAFEYTLSAFFIAFAVGVFALAARPSVKRPGIVIAAGNGLYTVASVVFVFADVFPLTTTGIVLTLGCAVYTLVMAELQYQGWRRAKA
jgi:peptidoglycan/LPS O-acetylase OafA/YrhL